MPLVVQLVTVMLRVCSSSTISSFSAGDCVFVKTDHHLNSSELFPCRDFEGEAGKCVSYFCAIPVGEGRRVLHGKQDSTKNNKFYFKDLVYLYDSSRSHFQR